MARSSRSAPGGLHVHLVSILAGFAANVTAVLSIVFMASIVMGPLADISETLALAAEVLLGVVASATALFLGGFVAGRIARESGLFNGALVGLLNVGVSAAILITSADVVLAGSDFLLAAVIAVAQLAIATFGGRVGGASGRRPSSAY
ncbi:MAG: hypothetical protein ACYC1C_05280 [Chloroflexota bacterium]